MAAINFFMGGFFLFVCLCVCVCVCVCVAFLLFWKVLIFCHLIGYEGGKYVEIEGGIRLQKFS